MKPVTLIQYFGPYWGHPDVTAEVSAAAVRLVATVNTLLSRAASDGIEPTLNPITDCHVSGSGNGGFRPQACPIGAAKSKHKTGHGIDLCDPHGHLAAWCYRNADTLQALGLSMEDHRWTPTWCHLQDVPPGPAGSPWRLDFVPSNDPPLCGPLVEQGRGA